MRRCVLFIDVLCARSYKRSGEYRQLHHAESASLTALALLAVLNLPAASYTASGQVGDRSLSQRASCDDGGPSRVCVGCVGATGVLS